MRGTGEWIRSGLVAGVIGVFAGGLTILLLEGAGHALLGTADPGDLSTITPPMFLAVLVAWIAGAGVAGALSTYWARSTSVAVGVVTGLVLLAGSISNMLVIPHPTWMVVGAVVLMPLSAVLAARGVARARGGGA